MAYHFRPSRPKAAKGTPHYSPHRPSKRDTLFQVERGKISPQKRDTQHLDDHRSRSYLQRETNVFKTSSERSDLTTGEKDIGRFSQAQSYNFQARIWPGVDQDRSARRFAPRCFDYTLNYHHYVLDIKKLEKGQEVPYLTSSRNGLRSSAQNGTPPMFRGGMTRRTPKSGSSSRKDSGEGLGRAENSTESQLALPDQCSSRMCELTLEAGGSAGDFHLKGSKSLPVELPEVPSAPQSPRASELSPKDSKNTLQDLIISEIEDELNESQPEMLNSGDLRVPVVTPIDTPRACSAVHNRHSVYSGSPNASSWNYSNFHNVAPQIHKPHLGAFITRIPPLKATVSREERRKRRSTHDNPVPNYQRYRILCDAFRPCAPQDIKPRSRYTQPNSIPSEVLDYCMGLVQSV